MTRTTAAVAFIVLQAAVQACSEPVQSHVARLNADESCDDCGRIRIARAVTLQDAVPVADPDQAAVQSAPAIARAGEDGSIWIVTGRDVHVYDVSGAHDRVLNDVVSEDDDAERNVPDLFGVRSIADLAFAGADSVLIIDTAAHRLVVMDRAGSGRRAVQLPAAARLRNAVVVDWPDRVLLTGRVGARTGLYELSAAGDHGVVRRDRYSAAEPPAARRYYLPPRFAADIWAVDDVPALNRWDETGRARTQVGRLRGRRAARGGPGDRGLPRIVAVAEDATGRIWVFSRIATEDTPAAWRSPEARRPGGRIEAGMEGLYHTHVEVLDPLSLRPLGRGLIAAWLVSAPGGSTAVVRTPGADGAYITRVYELELDDAR